MHRPADAVDIEITPREDRTRPVAKQGEEASGQVGTGEWRDRAVDDTLDAHIHTQRGGQHIADIRGRAGGNVEIARIGKDPAIVRERGHANPRLIAEIPVQAIAENVTQIHARAGAVRAATQPARRRHPGIRHRRTEAKACETLVGEQPGQTHATALAPVACQGRRDHGALQTRLRKSDPALGLIREHAGRVADVAGRDRDAKTRHCGVTRLEQRCLFNIAGIIVEHARCAIGRRQHGPGKLWGNAHQRVVVPTRQHRFIRSDFDTGRGRKSGGSGSAIERPGMCQKRKWERQPCA